MSRLNQLLEFHEEDPDDSFVRFALAAEYVKLKRYDDALRAFQELYEKDPAYVGLYYHYGKLLQRLGQSDEAASIYREGIALATRITDFHARSELQSALLEMEIEADE
jgi:tetratricopeptide (TPR) repeat protein